MKSLLLFVILSITAGTTVYAGASATDGATPCPPSQHVDATDAKTREFLKGKELTPVFPEKEVDVSVVQDADGTVQKIASREYFVVDKLTGKVLPDLMKTTCSSTCDTLPNQGSCGGSGCNPWGTGCSSHRCDGSGCGSGKCTTVVGPP